MNSGDLINREALLEKECCGRISGNDVRNAPAVDAVELPCKIGDTVWCIRNFHGHKHPQMGIVSEMGFTKEMKLNITVKYVGRGQWGEKIFATREAAEEALKEKKNV